MKELKSEYRRANQPMKALKFDGPSMFEYNKNLFEEAEKDSERDLWGVSALVSNDISLNKPQQVAEKGVVSSARSG